WYLGIDQGLSHPLGLESRLGAVPPDELVRREDPVVLWSWEICHVGSFQPAVGEVALVENALRPRNDLIDHLCLDRGDVRERTGDHQPVGDVLREGAVLEVRSESPG